MVWDCLIIGGGPAGLTAARYLARYRRSVLVIDSGNSRADLIPNSHNLPGFSGIRGRALLQKLAQHATEYGATLRKDTVTGLKSAQGTFEATLKSETIVGRRVLLATGIADRKPTMKSLDAAIANGVIRFCPICDAYEATDRKIAVMGTFRDAMPKAFFLRTYSRHVTLLATDQAPNRDALSTDGIEVVELAEANLEHRATGVRLHLRDGAMRDFDVLYPVLGCEIRSNLAIGLGARCTRKGLMEVNCHQETSVEGLFAAGDVVADLHQICVAEGHAVVAATAIHNGLAPNPR